MVGVMRLLSSSRWVASMFSMICGAVVIGCAARGIATVQTHHGHEFRCDRRYVLVERVVEQPNRWISRGCGFEADWLCERGECRLLDARSHGMGAP